MANLYRQEYTTEDPETGKRTKHRSKKWYGQYRDADGVRQRVPLSTDKSAAQAMLSELVRRVERYLFNPVAVQEALAVEAANGPSPLMSVYAMFATAAGCCENWRRSPQERRKGIGS